MFREGYQPGNIETNDNEAKELEDAKKKMFEQKKLIDEIFSTEQVIRVMDNLNTSKEAQAKWDRLTDHVRAQKEIAQQIYQNALQKINRLSESRENNREEITLFSSNRNTKEEIDQNVSVETIAELLTLFGISNKEELLKYVQNYDGKTSFRYDLPIETKDPDYITHLGLNYYKDENGNSKATIDLKAGRLADYSPKQEQELEKAA